MYKSATTKYSSLAPSGPATEAGRASLPKKSTTSNNSQSATISNQIVSRFSTFMQSRLSQRNSSSGDGGKDISQGSNGNTPCNKNGSPTNSNAGKTTSELLAQRLEKKKLKQNTSQQKMNRMLSQFKNVDTYVNIKNFIQEMGFNPVAVEPAAVASVIASPQAQQPPSSPSSSIPTPASPASGKMTNSSVLRQFDIIEEKNEDLPDRSPKHDFLQHRLDKMHIFSNQELQIPSYYVQDEDMQASQQQAAAILQRVNQAVGQKINQNILKQSKDVSAYVTMLHKHSKYSQLQFDQKTDTNTFEQELFDKLFNENSPYGSYRDNHYFLNNSKKHADAHAVLPRRQRRDGVRLDNSSVNAPLVDQRFYEQFKKKASAVESKLQQMLSQMHSEKWNNKNKKNKQQNQQGGEATPNSTKPLLNAEYRMYASHHAFDFKKQKKRNLSKAKVTFSQMDESQSTLIVDQANLSCGPTTLNNNSSTLQTNTENINNSNLKTNSSATTSTLQHAPKFIIKKSMLSRNNRNGGSTGRVNTTAPIKSSSPNTTQLLGNTQQQAKRKSILKEINQVKQNYSFKKPLVKGTILKKVYQFIQKIQDDQYWFKKRNYMLNCDLNRLEQTKDSDFDKFVEERVVINVEDMKSFGQMRRNSVVMANPPERILKSNNGGSGSGTPNRRVSSNNNPSLVLNSPNSLQNGASAAHKNY